MAERGNERVELLLSYADSGAPLPRVVEPGRDVRVDGVARVSGRCEFWSRHPVSGKCYLSSGPFQRTTGAMYGRYSTPRGGERSASEFALDPKRRTSVKRQELDSRDDTLTSGGPVILHADVSPGVYVQQLSIRIDPTPCDLGPDRAESGPVAFSVVDPAILSGLGCTASRAEAGSCRPLPDNSVTRVEDLAAPIPFVRFHNSASPIDLGLGPGWSSNQHGRLLAPDDRGRMLLLRSDGRGEVFQRGEDGRWRGPPNTPFAVREVAEGYTVTTTTGQVEHYDRGGRLLADRDAEGRERAFAYDSAGRLIHVADAEGRRLAFDYDESGRLAVLIPPDGAPIPLAW